MPRKQLPPTGRKTGPMQPDENAAAKALIAQHYGECGTLLEACRRANADYRTALRWKAADPAFALALDAEGDAIRDLVESTAFKRMTDSDRILERMLMSLLRDKYGDTRKIEHSGPGGMPIQIQTVDQVKAQLIAVAYQFPTVVPRLRQALQETLDALPSK